MKNSKRRRLEAAGWRVGSTAAFLGLSRNEATFVDLKVRLARSLRAQRQRKKLTQTQLADLLGSSQSRVAKMEAAEAEVTLDLLVRALLATGVTRESLAKIIAGPMPRPAA